MEKHDKGTKAKPDWVQLDAPPRPKPLNGQVLQS